MSTAFERAFFDPQVSDPVSPEPGELWYNDTLGAFRFFTGTTTHTLPGSVAAPGPVPYDEGVTITVPAGHSLIRVNPCFTGANELRVQGDAELRVL